MPYLADVAIFGLWLLCLVVYALGWNQTGKYPIPFCLDTLLAGVAHGIGMLALMFWSFGIAHIGLDYTCWPLLIWLFLLYRSDTGPSLRTVAKNFLKLFAGLRALRGLDRWLFIYLSVVFLLTFLLTLAPPNATDWDSLMYHLAAPAQYLRHGKIVELPYDHHTYFPFTMEMLFLWGMAVKGPVLAKLFHWLMLPLSCGALVAIGKRHFSLRVGLFAAALFASIPLVQAEASTAYIDLGLTAFTLLAYMCFLNWKTSGEKSWLLWCGAFCGFCLGTKYLGVLTFAWLGVWVLGSMMKGRAVQIKPLATFAALALLLGGGWYVRNFVQTGNPVYPFAYGVFGGKNWNAEMAARYEDDQRAYGFGRAPQDLLLLPLRVSFAPFNVSAQNINSSNSGENGKVVQRIAGIPFWPIVNFQAAEPQNGLFDSPGMVAQLPLRTMLGPVLLAFGVPLLFVRRKPWILNFLLVSFAFYGLFWFATGQYLRYLVPAFALLCLPCGWMIEKCLSRSAFLKYVTGICLTLWLLLTPLLTLRDGLNALDVTLGFVTPQEYLSRSFRPYDAMRRASSETPEDARFAVYGEPRTLYLERDYFWADDPHNNLIDYAKIKTGADLVKALKAQGATHIFWNFGQPAFGGPPPQMQEAIDKKLAELLFEVKGCRVYRLR